MAPFPPRAQLQSPQLKYSSSSVAKRSLVQVLGQWADADGDASIGMVLDRMVWLYEDAIAVNELYRSWLDS